MPHDEFPKEQDCGDLDDENSGIVCHWVRSPLYCAAAGLPLPLRVAPWRVQSQPVLPPDRRLVCLAYLLLDDLTAVITESLASHGRFGFASLTRLIYWRSEANDTDRHLDGL